MFDLSPRLYWQWVGLNALGFGIATTICFSAQVSEFNIEMLWLSGLIVGSITGICQAIALKKKVPKLRYWQWILANILGGYAGIWGSLYLIFNVLDFLNQHSPYLLFTAFGGCVGICISLAQMLMLRFHARGVRFWGIVNMLGRAIAWGMSSLIIGLTFGDSLATTDIMLPIHASLIGGVLGGAIFGIVTGLAVGKLQPKVTSTKSVARQI